MAENAAEKPAPTVEDHQAESQTHSAEEAGEIHHRRPWMYHSFSIGPLKLPYYASPLTQLVLVAFVCFLCPGMFNALNGLGGGGQLDPSASNNANTALYSTFSVIGFFAGSIANRIGIKLTLSLGGIGYFIYSSSLLCYNHTQNSGFVIFAGALLGVCAGLLWACQGAIMMSYPPEGSKGRYIFIFWVIFNLGGVIGSLIPLGQNMHSTVDHVNDGTYVAFMVLMFVGAVLSWFLCDSKHIERPDGSHVILMKNPTWKSELLGLLEVLKSDWYIVALFPMFFSSNWFYTYHFNGVNLARFNIRTRSLNNVLYWSSQMVGASVFGNLLDIKHFRRTTRAKAGWVALMVLTLAIWGGGFAWQRQYTRASTNPKNGYVPWDWTHSGYVGGMFLYIFYGFYDAAWQTCVYWFMGSLTNNGRKLANFAGFYKGIQSAGAAITWRLDAMAIPYMNEFASCWALLLGSLLVALPVILFKVHDTVPVEDDLKFSDETAEEVAATGAQREPSVEPRTEKI